MVLSALVLFLFSALLFIFSTLAIVSFSALTLGLVTGRLFRLVVLVLFIFVVADHLGVLTDHLIYLFHVRSFLLLFLLGISFPHVLSLRLEFLVLVPPPASLDLGPETVHERALTATGKWSTAEEVPVLFQRLLEVFVGVLFPVLHLTTNAEVSEFVDIRGPAQ